MSSDPPTLDEFEEMERRATVRPWRTNTLEHMGEDWCIADTGKAPDGKTYIITTDNVPASCLHGAADTDATFLAALRNAAPGLLRLWRAAKSLAEWAHGFEDKSYWYEFIVRCGDNDGEDWHALLAALADLEAKEGEGGR